MLFGTLANASVGDLVTFPDSVNKHTFKVVNVRDTRTRPLLKDTLRRRPENIRSVINATMNGCEIVFSKPIGSGMLA